MKNAVFFLLLTFRLLLHVAGQIGKVAGQIDNLTITREIRIQLKPVLGGVIIVALSISSH